MALQNQIKNMSGVAGLYLENNNTQTGSDSDTSSFSADFKEIDAKRYSPGDKRLGKEAFGGRRGVTARVLFGEIFAVDDDYEMQWEDEEKEVILFWRKECNLLGQTGISCDNGSGWAGWNQDESCYLRDDDNIEKNEFIMQIIEIDEVVSSVSAKPVNEKLIRKAEREARKATKKAVKADGVVKATKKAVKADGVVKATKKAVKATKKAVEADGVVKATKKAVKADEVKESSKSVNSTRSVNTDNADKCAYVFTKGDHKDDACDSPVKTGEDYCTKHKAVVDKKAVKEVGKEKIEKSVRLGEKSSDMALQNQIKNMAEILSASLAEILTGALKEKYAGKAIAALQTDEAQATIIQVLEKNMLTKTIPAKGRTKSRRKRDPAAPKRGCSAYIFYCKDARLEIKRVDPEMKSTDITKEMGRRWKLLSEKDKKSYEKLAKADKTRFEDEMKEYTPSAEWLAESSVESDSDDGKKKKKSSTNKRKGPKRARSAYIFFCTDMRAQVKEDNNDMDAKEVTAELGRIWREDVKEDPEKAEKYNKLAEDDKIRYNDDKDAWVPDPEASDEEKHLPIVKKSKKSKKAELRESDSEQSDTTEKKKSSKKKSSKKKSSKKKSSDNAVAPNGFAFFCQKTRKSLREENPGWTIKKLTKEMEKLWKSMDDDEHEVYEEELRRTVNM